MLSLEEHLCRKEMFATRQVDCLLTIQQRRQIQILSYFQSRWFHVRLLVQHLFRLVYLGGRTAVLFARAGVTAQNLLNEPLDRSFLIGVRYVAASAVSVRA